MENAEFFRQVLRDFGGLVVLADPKKPFMQPKVGERILKVFSQFGYTPEMFRNDISSSKDVAFQRSRAFLHLVDEDTNHDRATEEKIYLVIEVGDKYAVVPLFYDSVWR